MLSCAEHIGRPYYGFITETMNRFLLSGLTYNELFLSNVSILACKGTMSLSLLVPPFIPSYGQKLPPNRALLTVISYKQLVMGSSIMGFDFVSNILVFGLAMMGLGFLRYACTAFSLALGLAIMPLDFVLAKFGLLLNIFAAGK